MKKDCCLTLVLAALFLACSHLAAAQTADVGLPPGVPRLIKFSGVLKNASGYLLDGAVGVSFAVYADSAGGEPLWEETQNVQFSQGRYTVFLGQSRNTGIPAEIFASGQTRWVGVRILAAGEREQARTRITSVPYALKAVDADTVGGLPASAFLRANPDGSGQLPSTPVVALAPGTQDAQSQSSLAVTTPGGTIGSVPEFSANSVIGNSPIKVANGVVSMRNMENIRFADQFRCPSSPGCGGKSDFGAQVNAAYASCPANGCHIRIPAGSYTVSTPISFTTPQKAVKLECDPGTSNNVSYPDHGVTELHYTGTSGAAITMATGGGTGSGIEGCTIIGPGVSSTNKAIGLQLMLATKQSYKDLFISGFNVGLQFGNWVYLDNFYNLQLESNATNLYAPSSITIGTGESVGFFGGVFTNKSATGSFSPTCVDFEGGQGIVISFYNVSFDQCGVTLNIPGGQQFLFSGSHFENPEAATNSDFLTIGSNCVSCNVILSGSDIYETHPSSRTELISIAGGARLSIVGGIYLAQEPIPQVISSSHPANAITVLGADKFQIAAWVSGTYSAFTTIDPREYHPLTVAGGPIILGGNPSINGSLMSAPLSQSRTWTFPDASGTVLLSGTSSAANAQSKRVSGCGTVARAGATCTTTIRWNHAFADTSYTVSCTGEGIISGVPLSGGLITKNEASVTFQTVTATSEAAQYANVDCIALHE